MLYYCSDSQQLELLLELLIDILLEQGREERNDDDDYSLPKM
jgi:hypothetical protein